MKRTPEKADADALAYAGFLGHRYAVTVKGTDEPRRTMIHCNEVREWEIEELEAAGDEPRAFEQIRYRSKKGRRWRRVR